MGKNTHTIQGFTLIEFMIAVGLLIIVMLITVPTLFGQRNKSQFDGTVKEITALLREAQSKSVSQALGTTWGVHLRYDPVNVSFFALFNGTTYTGTNSAGYNRLPPGVEYISSTLGVSNMKEILFSSLDGATASTSFRLYMTSRPEISSTISVASSGVVNY